MAFNFGMQRQMPWDMILKVNYVGRLARKLLAQEDANQVLDFVDPVSGEMLFQLPLLPSSRKPAKAWRRNNLKVQPWFENVVSPASRAATALPATRQISLQGIQPIRYLQWRLRRLHPGHFQLMRPPTWDRLRSSLRTRSTTAQDSPTTTVAVVLQKNMSHGLQFDFNYTWSHSIDNVSFFANSSGDTGIGGIGLVCDAIRPRECRASSDFDIRRYITSDATYQLPFGKGRMFLRHSSRWTNEIIGGWDISGLGEWHTGLPWSGASSAFVASYSNDAPPILNGNPALAKTSLTKLPGGGVSDFADAKTASKQFEGPVGFQIGPRPAR